jgi:hypothetical protein
MPPHQPRSSDILVQLRDFFSLPDLPRKPNGTTDEIDWPTLLGVVGILLIAMVIAVGTILLGVLLLRRIWRYATRIRRKAALRNFERNCVGSSASCNQVRRFSHGLMIRAHSPKSRRFHSTSKIFGEFSWV